MIKKKLIIFISLFFASCTTNQTQKDLRLDGDFYTIDLDGKKEPSIRLSSIFKNVRTIFLETNEACLMGDIYDFQVFDGYMYILDYKSAKSLFVFDMEGKFIRKIGGIGGGPGEYKEAGAFTLDTENRIIYLRDRNIVHKYKFDGTFLHSFTIPAEGNVHFIHFYNGRLYSDCVWWRPSKDDVLLLEIDPNDGKIISQSVSVKYNKGWNKGFYSGSNNFFKSRMNNPPRYNAMFMDYIVSLGKEVKPYIELKSKNRITEKDVESFTEDKGMLNVNNILRKSRYVNSFIENDDLIYFKCGMMPFSTSVILYKKSGEVKLANYSNNDLIFKQDETGMLEQFVFSDSKGAYVIYNTQSLAFGEYQRYLNKNDAVPNLNNLDQLMELTFDSNPVIFFYEYK